MEKKIFAVSGQSKAVETRGAWEGVVLPFLRFEVASSPEEAIEQAFQTMDKEEDRWLDNANALVNKGQQPTTMRPFKPIRKDEWVASEVSVPGYKIILEVATN